MAMATCRECEAEVSTEAESCPNCGATDPVPGLPPGRAPHTGPWDDWVRFQLQKRSPEEIADVLAEHGAHPDAALKEVERQQQLMESESRRRSKRSRSRGSGEGVPIAKILGFGGATLLLIGAFLPLVSLPLVGEINYVHNGRGDGILIVALAVIAAAEVAYDRYIWVAITGALASGLMIFTYVNLQSRLADTQEQVAQELSGNPFRGMADTMVQSIQLEWGWAVLILGVVCLFASAIMYAKNPNSR